MTTWFDQLNEALSGVTRPGDYCASGSVVAPLPRVDVDGVGTLSFPLPVAQAEALAAAAEPAPYGRGAATLVDPNVRRCWQIAPGRVRLPDRAWRDTLADVVQRAARGLGVEGAVSTELYKLLVYDAGSFFLPHRDTEKAPGMFATLVVVLPSLHTGGELVVRHDGREITLALAGEELSRLGWGAFYADCVHELRPVTSGWRVALVFNLTRAEGARPIAPANEGHVEAAAGVLRGWAGALGDARDEGAAVGFVGAGAEIGEDEEEAGADAYEDDYEDDFEDDDEDDEDEDAAAAADGPPGKLVYLLEHHYTPAELGFARLKNRDAAIGAVLVRAAERAGCAIHLAMVSIEESGMAEPVLWNEPSSDFDVIEVDERIAWVESLLRPDDTPAPYGRLPVEDEEIYPPGAIDDEDPDEQHLHEATGNGGATFERTYRRAALVVWPRARELAMVLESGPDAAVGLLAELVDASEAGDVEARAGADRLVRLITHTWTRMKHTPEQVVATLDLAVRLDGEAVEGLLDVIASAPPPAGFGAALAARVGRIGEARVAAWAEATVRRHREADAVACLDLVVGLSTLPARAWRPAAEALVGRLPGHPEILARLPEGQQKHALADFWVTLLGVLGGLDDEGPGDAAVAHLLGAVAPTSMDTIVVPTAVRFGAGRGYLRRLRSAVLAFLDRRIAVPLTPPLDARREDPGTCRCADCRGLGRFLVDPIEVRWELRAKEADRSHVEEQIRRFGPDVACETLRRGSPYTLVCRKTTASYDRKVAQRRADLAAREQLTD